MTHIGITMPEIEYFFVCPVVEWWALRGLFFKNKELAMWLSFCLLYSNFIEESGYDSSKF